MLSNVGLGKEFWAEVVTYVSHLINRLPSTTIDDRILLEVWFGLSRPDPPLRRNKGREPKLGLFTCFFRHWCAQVL